MSQASFPAEATLAGIPSETRVEIFKQLLQSDHPLRITFSADGYLLLADYDEGVREIMKSSGLLRVSKSFFTEASTILYATNNFVMKWSASVALVSEFKMSAAKSLRHLKIECNQVNSPTFGLARFIDGLIPSTAAQLRQVTIDFNDEVKLLACVAELTKAVTSCGAFKVPILEVVVFPRLKRYKKPVETTPEHNAMVSTLRRRTKKLDGLLQTAESQSNDINMFYKYTAPEFVKIKIVGKIAKEFLPKFEAHTCESGQCEMRNLSNTQTPVANINDPMLKVPRRYVWAKKATTAAANNALPEVNMRRWLPRMPEEYAAELLTEFNMTMEELYQL
ncbi:hypothetical protein LTR84_002619 [Exophiala bonariae]|uniref:Uncharacterized protein n=1 Tax=Exophiala bonariae TaxID=1690606 RepID=A0AAV9N9Z6_9EURO|nr:hypothetical protein LTR84_002619 [Exophiala bonariae]